MSPVRIRTDSHLPNEADMLGTVEHKFRRSFNVLAQLRLFNFHVQPEMAHPLSVIVPQKLLDQVEIGSPIRIVSGHLRFGSSQYVIRRDLTPPNKGTLKSVIELRCVARLGALLRQFGHFSEVTDAYLFDRHTSFSTSLKCVMAGLKAGSFSLLKVVDSFGGGEGLTPAWDDFCAGILLADRCCDIPVVGIEDPFFRELFRRTTLTSFWNIWCAARGTSSMILESFLSDLLVDRLKTLLFMRCIGLGHTSGTDMICGIHARIRNEPFPIIEPRV